MFFGRCPPGEEVGMSRASSFIQTAAGARCTQNSPLSTALEKETREEFENTSVINTVSESGVVYGWVVYEGVVYGWVVYP